MTRKAAAGPFRSAGPWRAISGYGEPGELTDLRILPPPKYRARPGEWREPAGYGVTARGRLAPGRVDLDTVTVTDQDTGAALTVAMAGGPVTASLPPDLAPRDLARLWRDGRYLAGWAGAQRGRPPGITTIQDDDEIRVVIAGMRTARRRVTMPAVAATSGTFTLAELRGYLRVTGRTWTEFLGTY
jgi:hypothetical protein